jgi:hypothetical protein
MFMQPENMEGNNDWDPNFNKNELRRTMRTFWVKNRTVFKPGWLLKVHLAICVISVAAFAVINGILDLYNDDSTGPDCDQVIISATYVLGMIYGTVVFIIGILLRKVVDGFGIRAELAMAGISWLIFLTPLAAFQLFGKPNIYILFLPMAGYILAFHYTTVWQVYRVLTLGKRLPKLRSVSLKREVHMSDLSLSVAEPDESREAVKNGLLSALQNQDARVAFKDFLMKEFAIENILVSTYNGLSLS